MRKLPIAFVCLALTASGATAGNDLAVFVVHGTYDATGEWPLQVAGKATFASELARGTRWTVEPFLWRTSVHHERRVEAAKDLAAQIDRHRAKRIAIVGHSHGGNVAILAAEYCKRDIETIVCLATPHVYLLVKGSDGKPMPLSVYCTPSARKRIGRVVSVTSASDTVVKTYADFRKGISEQQAIIGTEEWRKQHKQPRIWDDGGPVRELFEDLFGTPATTNLLIHPHLLQADLNLTIGTLGDGINAHRMMHGRRMGWMVGRLLETEGGRGESLASLYLANVEDDGEPIESALHERWLDENRGQLEFSGWMLTDLRVTSKSLVKPSGKNWDLDGSPPDLFYKVRSTGRADVPAGDSTLDVKFASWRPFIHALATGEVSIEIWDQDLFGGHDHMGTIAVVPKAGRSTVEHDQFTAEMTWTNAHR